MIVCYTAIFGQSDSLKKAPHADLCFCFTDDPTLSGSGWNMMLRPKVDKPRRSARLMKMLPNLAFPDASASLWLDGSIEVRDWSKLMADIGDAEIACLPHPDRSDCYAEGETVIRLKIAHDTGKQQIRAAMAKYRAQGFKPTALSTTGLFYRKHTERVAAFNGLWRGELNQYGTNDQVHVDYCAWRTGITIKHLRGHYRDNPYAVYDQADHHKRRKPQFLREADCRDYLETA